MGKTDTIRQRRVDVWVPSLEAKARWKEVAEARGISLSKLIIQVVEESIDNESPSQSEVDAMQQQILDLEAELVRRDERIHELTQLKERLQEELDHYRSQDFLRPDGLKVLDHRLISILADAKGHDGRQRVVTEDELVRRLRIEPGSEEMQALVIQMEALELHGVVKGTQRGWIWHGQ